MNNAREMGLDLFKRDTVAATARDSSRSEGRSTQFLRIGALILLIITCWLVSHRYRGLGYDAQLYAFQALAHIEPSLRNDLFLQNSSQDKFTLFSPLYALLIRVAGVESAALWLTGIGLATFLVSTWYLARALSRSSWAWLSVALVVVTTSSYGAFDVIRYCEEYLTARTFAEAFTVAALAAWFARRPVLSAAAITFALAMHPIMALPGLGVLVFLQFRYRWSALMAAGCVVTALLATLIAQQLARPSGVFMTIDPQWLYMIRERSQYLLLDLWTWDDWQLNIRPFISLALTAAVVTRPATRKLCLVTMLVGLAGLGIAALAGLQPPLALLVQAQPWRAVWIVTFVAIVLLPPTIQALWGEKRCGLLCIGLLVLAWTYPLINQLGCIAGALAIFSIRARIDARAAKLMLIAGLTLAAVVCGWVLASVWVTIGKPFDSGHGPLALQTLQNVLGLKVPMVAALVGLWWMLMMSRSAALLITIGALLAGLCVPLIPLSLHEGKPLSTAYKPGDFADWQAIMRPEANVLVGAQGSSALFIWFILQRPSYLTEAQSAGLVFSRETALEVKRRSDLIAGFVEPNWAIYSAIERYNKDPKNWRPAKTHALTPALLRQICSDPALGYVIAKENIGFGAHTHTAAGFWKNWNLYDCAVARSGRRNDV